VQMHALNLALHGEHTHSNVHVVCAVLQNTEEFGWCAHSMSISCLATVYSMVHADYCARWGHIELWHGAMHREKCMWNISARYKNCAQQVSVQEPKLCVVDIGAQRKSSARKLLARRRRKA
jgi:hypothetical protein